MPGFSKKENSKIITAKSGTVKRKENKYFELD